AAARAVRGCALCADGAHARAAVWAAGCACPEGIRVPHPVAMTRWIGSGQRALAPVAWKARLAGGGEFAVAVGDERAERGWVGANGVGETAADAKTPAVGGLHPQRAHLALQPAFAGDVADHPRLGVEPGGELE